MEVFVLTLVIPFALILVLSIWLFIRPIVANMLLSKEKKDKNDSYQYFLEKIKQNRKEKKDALNKLVEETKSKEETYYSPYCGDIVKFIQSNYTDMIKFHREKHIDSLMGLLDIFLHIGDFKKIKKLAVWFDKEIGVIYLLMDDVEFAQYGNYFAGLYKELYPESKGIDIVAVKYSSIAGKTSFKI